MASELENSFIKCPLESLTKHARQAQKVSEHELSQLSTQTRKLLKMSSKRAPFVLKHLKGMRSKLEGYRTKLIRGHEQCKKFGQRCKTRLESLVNDEGGAFAERQHTDRMITNHILRRGHFDLYESMNPDVMNDMVEIGVFKVHHDIIEALRTHDCAPCLAWCRANRSRLRRMNCVLEFEVYVQQFIMKLRDNDVIGAVSLAQKHFADYMSTCGDEIRKCMGMVALYPALVPDEYAYLLSDDRWTYLESEFSCALYDVNGLTQHSLLDIVLHTGLAALKTPHCACEKPSSSSSHYNVNCPTCSERIRPLVQQLPMYPRTNSSFVCPINGTVMDDNDPPMALPNGHVYSTSALTQMSEANKGTVRCPATKKKFKFRQAKPVYLV